MQRGLLDDAAARGIDQIGAGLHAREPRGVEHAFGFLRAWTVDADEVGLAKQVTEPLLTCEAVLAETAFHLRNADLALAMVREGLVTVSFACAEHIEQLAALFDTA